MAPKKKHTDINIKKYDIEELRNIIGLVPQNPTLFEGTIRSNMCWRKPDATDEEIIKALKMPLKKQNNNIL